MSKQIDQLIIFQAVTIKEMAKIGQTRDAKTVVDASDDLQITMEDKIFKISSKDFEYDYFVPIENVRSYRIKK